MLRTRLSEALKEAMKAKDERKVATLRLVLAALKDREIAARGKGESEVIADRDVLEMLTKMIRQRRESIKMYEEGGRIDLAEREQEEIQVIETYLPRQLTEEELRQAVEQVVAELGASGLKDMGRVMGEMKQRYAGQMDPGKASTMVKSLLT